MNLREGTFLQNRYEIVEKIGSGGMSEVYKVMDTKLNRLVALKLLKAEYCDNLEFVSKFKCEAQAAAGLSHPNVVSVYDVIDEGELHYIVMELVEGVTLKDFISAKGKLEIKEAIVVSIQAAQGIGAAHDQNIVHRDIKPQNIIMSADGKVKVADFGIAGAVSSETIESIAMGSVHYISPEQAKGESGDERSDIYSLGISMFEMVTGQVPFDGNNTVSIAIQQIEKELPLPRSFNPAVTPAFETIILKCTQKRKDRRYQNINDLIVDLRKALMDPATNGDIKNPEQNEDDFNTRIISQEELGEINSQAKQHSEKTLSDKKLNSAKRHVIIDEDIYEEKGSGSDKAITILGIILAIVIVGAAVFFITKFTGILKDDESISAVLQPSSDSLPDTQVYMPSVKGISSELAVKMLHEDYSLEAKFIYVESDDEDLDMVLDQSPAEGKIVDKYSYVTLTVGQGTNTINLESANMIGISLGEVRAFLDSKKLSFSIEEVFSENMESGTVVDFEPKKVAKDGEVKIFVSKGPEIVTSTVPSILGLTEDDAIALLAENNLLPGDVTQIPSDTSGIAPGLITSQAVAAGTEIEPHTRINYSISTNPSMIESLPEDVETVPGIGSYVGSINQLYDLENALGPGASKASAYVAIRLVQTGPDGQTYETTLMQPREIRGNTTIPVRFRNIEGLYGVDQGDVQIINAKTGEIYMSYTIDFFNVD